MISTRYPGLAALFKFLKLQIKEKKISHLISDVYRFNLFCFLAALLLLIQTTVENKFFLRFSITARITTYLSLSYPPRILYKGKTYTFITRHLAGSRLSLLTESESSPVLASHNIHSYIYIHIVNYALIY